MTLTLDEVRNTKFHMARRAGYEVTDVDLFVDRVEASFAQLVEENQMLKRQIEALKASQGDAPVSAEEDGRDDTVRQQPPAAQPTPPAPAAEPVTAVAQSGGERLVVTTSKEASPAVIRLVQMATEQAETLVNEAEAEARATVEEARREAHEITTDARTKAERVESEARVNAEKVRSEAMAKANDVEREVAERRTALFTQLEQERDTLKASVRELREFEEEFRRSFTTRLQEQLAQLERGDIKPVGKPVLLDDDEDDDAPADGSPTGRRGHGQSTSTPRLDALIRDNS